MNTDITRIEFARRLGAPAGGRIEPKTSPTVIATRDPTEFMAAFGAAVAAGGDVFLADPGWGSAERARLDELLATGAAAGPPEPRHRGWLMIPTGGTSGGMKFARHDQETFAAAVRGFAAHFGLRRVDAIGILPLYHVSGLMAWMRCALTGGRYVAWDWKRIEAGEFPPENKDEERVISLVPTQVQRLLGQPSGVAWLRRFRAVFLGGGPGWPELLEQAAAARLPLSISYGMTETAAMVTALRPDEFLAGNRSCGAALPHAAVEIESDGRVRVTAASTFRGYFPNWNEEREFMTADLGRLDGRGHLSVLGRSDTIIITGGKKVHPHDVEAALRASGEFSDVVVVGVADPEWGEAVVACYPATDRPPDLGRAVAGLAAFQRPKRFVAVPAWPRNAQGKVNRAALIALAQAPGGTSH